MADPYLQPNGTLRNKLGITDPGRLLKAEEEASAAGLIAIRVGNGKSARGSAWAPAVHHPRSFEAVIERARAMSKKAGIPEYETYGRNVPFFVRPQDERRPQRSRPRERDGGAR